MAIQVGQRLGPFEILSAIAAREMAKGRPLRPWRSEEESHVSLKTPSHRTAGDEGL